MNLICWAMDFQGRKWVRSPFNLENSRSSQINRRRAPSTISSSARAVRKRLQNSEPYDVSIHRTRSDEWRRNVGTVGCRDINHLTFLLLTMLSLTQLQHFRFYGNLLSRTIKRISFWMLNWGVFFFGRRHQQMWFTFMISARRAPLNWFTKKERLKRHVSRKNLPTCKDLF